MAGPVPKLSNARPARLYSQPESANNNKATGRDQQLASKCRRIAPSEPQEGAFGDHDVHGLLVGKNQSGWKLTS